MNSLTINLMVKDVSACIDFYKDNLGFEVVMGEPVNGFSEWAMMTSGDVSIMFHEEKSIKTEYPNLKDNKVTASFTMYIKTDKVEALYNNLKDKVEIVLDYHQTPYGANEFAIYDNNGYVLTFAE